MNNITQNKKLLVLGSLGLSSILIPPNFGINFFGIGLEDIPLVGMFVFLSVNFLSNNTKNYNRIDYLWASSTIFFYIYSSFLNSSGVDLLNRTNIRFVFMSLLAYLFMKFLVTNKLYNNEETFFSFLIVVIFINSLFLIIRDRVYLQDVGWVSANIDSNNIFLSGRLAGLQGSGPNVFGFICVVASIYFLNLWFLNKGIFKSFSLIMFLISLISLVFSKSRGSYIAFVIALLIYFFLKEILNIKSFIIFSSSIVIFSLFIFSFNPQTILKSSDRGVLGNIALENIKPLVGTGGGNYVYDTFKPSFDIVDLQQLQDVFNFDLNKINSDIFPADSSEKYNFKYEYSDEGYSYLSRYILDDNCVEESKICQIEKTNVFQISRVLIAFFNSNEQSLSKSKDLCLDNFTDDTYISRVQFACIFYDQLITSGDQVEISNNIFTDVEPLQSNYFSSLESNSLLVNCSYDLTSLCPDRTMSIGELAKFLELAMYKGVITIDDLYNLCPSCKYKNYHTFLRLKFDYKDGLVPRSIVQFFISENGNQWNQVGETQTYGDYIDLKENPSFLEVGGWADGQSFGNNWLNGEISKISITTEQDLLKINFNEAELNNLFYLYKPNTLISYEDINELKFTDFGVISYSPNKYWIAIPHNLEFTGQDFIIDLEISLPSIPSNKQVLISSSSAFNSGKHSWKWYIYDSRLFFEWADSTGTYSNKVGDLSLSSGVLATNNNKIVSLPGRITSNSHLNQLTTAHNGYLTFAVEYGLLLTVIFYSLILLILYKSFLDKKKNYLSKIVIIAFLIQNLTNDLIYSPDASLFLFICISFLVSGYYSSISKFSVAKS